MLLRTLDLVAASVEFVRRSMMNEVGWSGAEQAKQHKFKSSDHRRFPLDLARVRPSARPSFISRAEPGRSRRTGRRVSVKVYTHLHSEKSARRALS